MVKADLSDEKQVQRHLRGVGCGDSTWQRHPVSLSPWENVLSQNIITTYNVFEEARRANVAKLFLPAPITPARVHDENKHFRMRLELCKEHGLVKLDDPPAPIHFTASRNYLARTWAGIMARFYASKWFRCVLAGRNVKK